MKRSNGFTLIELLFVVGLAALIGICIYAMFASSVDMMRRISQTAVTEEIDFFWEKMDREISSQVFYEGVAFEGGEVSFRFPARLEADPENPAMRGIGRVTISFNESADAIERRQEGQADFFDGKEGNGTVKRMLTDVKDAKFQYFVYQKVEKTYAWVDEWNSAEHKKMIPLAVKIDIECERGGETYGSERTIQIPITQSKG